MLYFCRQRTRLGLTFVSAMAAYVSHAPLGALLPRALHQHTSAYVSIRQRNVPWGALLPRALRQHTSAYVSIRQRNAPWGALLPRALPPSSLLLLLPPSLLPSWLLLPFLAPASLAAQS